MLPLIAGFLVAGPRLRLPLRPLRRAAVRDRRDAARGAQLPAPDAAAGRLLVHLVRADPAAERASAWGSSSSPNRAGVMNSLPPSQRGVGGGMNATFQNSASVLSIGVFFSLMIIGLAASLPAHAPRRPRRARRARGVRGARLAPAAGRDASSPRSSATTRCRTCSARTRCTRCTPAQAHELTGRSFFPHLISRAVPDGADRTRSCSRSSPASSPRSPRSCAAASTTSRSRRLHDSRALVRPVGVPALRREAGVRRSVRRHERGAACARRAVRLSADQGRRCRPRPRDARARGPQRRST